MDNADDYVTINITQTQTTALTFILMKATRAGLLNDMPRDLERAFLSFVEMMMVEIDRQKLNGLGN